MLDKQIFDKMLTFYQKSTLEMKHLGELDWYNAAKQTEKRLILYLHGNLSETSLQLARECHADLQGYIQMKFGSSIIKVDSYSSEDYYFLYELEQQLILIGGNP